MSVLRKALDWYARALLFVGGAAMVAMMLHIATDVLSKWLLGDSIVGTLEMVTHYYMVACIFLPMAFVQSVKGQIVVDVFTQHLPPRPHAVVEAAAGALSLLFVAGLAYNAAWKAAQMTEIGETTNARVFMIEIWPSRWIVVAAAVGMAVHLAVQIVDDLALALSGRRLLPEAPRALAH